tara:strand:+ start:225 stop:494 length:270 start_codon:yes stop_codon:yes gene_type:complete
MKLQVVVHGIIEFVAVLFGPSCKVNFPNIKKTTSRSVEGYSVSLHLIPVMIGIKAVASPIVVGVVGVGGKLKKDFRVLAWISRPYHEVK